MDLLIDTHFIIWSISSPEILPKKARDIISDNSNNCFVSIASLWEIAIKHSLGKLVLKDSLEQIFTIIDKTGFDILPVSSSHILKVSTLPLFHRDPFDRIIIAQSIVENLTIMTKDNLFSEYGAKLF